MKLGHGLQCGRLTTGQLGFNLCADSKHQAKKYKTTSNMDNVLLQTKAAAVKLIVLDVDGVMTDGRTYIDENCIETKVFSYRDGFGIHLATRIGVRFAIITGKKSPIVDLRAEQLGIEEVHQGFENKGNVLKDIMARNGLGAEEVAYMGDDLFDIPAMRLAGLSAAPADAANEVKDFVHWVSACNGGCGAVRELIEMILRAKGKWEEARKLFTGE